jgi:hexosaminidase
MANSCFPGLEIRYTTDGSEPVPDSPLYMEPVSVSGIASVRAFDTRGRGSRVSIAVPQ